MANTVDVVGFRITNAHLQSSQDAVNIRLERDDQNKIICPISLEELKAGDFVYKAECCNKVFKRAFLERSLQTSPVCPMCRRRINILSLNNQAANGIYHRVWQFIFREKFFTTAAVSLISFSAVIMIRDLLKKTDCSTRISSKINSLINEKNDDFILCISKQKGRDLEAKKLNCAKISLMKDECVDIATNTLKFKKNEIEKVHVDEFSQKCFITLKKPADIIGSFLNYLFPSKYSNRTFKYYNSLTKDSCPSYLAMAKEKVWSISTLDSEGAKVSSFARNACKDTVEARIESLKKTNYEEFISCVNNQSIDSSDDRLKNCAKISFMQEECVDVSKNVLNLPAGKIEKVDIDKTSQKCLITLKKPSNAISRFFHYYFPDPYSNKSFKYYNGLTKNGCPSNLSMKDRIWDIRTI